MAITSNPLTSSPSRTSASSAQACSRSDPEPERRSLTIKSDPSQEDADVKSRPSQEVCVVIKSHPSQEDSVVTVDAKGCKVLVRELRDIRDGIQLITKLTPVKRSREGMRLRTIDQPRAGPLRTARPQRNDPALDDFSAFCDMSEELDTGPSEGSRPGFDRRVGPTSCARLQEKLASA